MSSKDIRDIAAYWGCSYSARVMVDMRYEQFKKQNGTVDSDLLRDLGNDMLIWKDFRLSLRPLSTLTDNEINALYCAIQCKEYDEDLQKKVFRSKYEFAINFSYPLGDSRNATFVMYGTRIKFDGLIYTEVAEYNGGCQDTYCDNAQAGYAYLQSIGVYVPGTINKDFVTLI